MAKNTANYGNDSIRQLKDEERVRLRPAVIFEMCIRDRLRGMPNFCGRSVSICAMGVISMPAPYPWNRATGARGSVRNTRSTAASYSSTLRALRTARWTAIGSAKAHLA